MQEFRLTGIKLNKQTTNEGGQSEIDCGTLWRRFETENILEMIQGKLSNEIYAVYYEYEGDHTKPYSYFIGCKVNIDALPGEGLKSIVIPAGNYAKLVAKGIMPDCVASIWREIWKSDINRKYSYDFEIYDERSHDWNNAEVDVYLSINE